LTSMPRSKPGIDQLLIAVALDADVRRRLVDFPEEAFQDFDLTEEEKDLLRRPDQRLLPLLGAVIAHQRASPAPEPRAASAAPQPHAVVEAPTLPDFTLVLTLVPCAHYENGRVHKLSYAVWVNPLPADADPESLPPLPGAVFPGQPLTPLHAVIQVSPLPMEDAAGQPLIGLSAAFRKSSNIAAPPPHESAGRPAGSPFGSDLRSAEVQAAVAAVRGTSTSPATGERYNRLIDLLHVLRGREPQ